MFLIMGTGQGRKKLNFDQVIVCGHCGRNGHLEVYVAYSYFSLFFIPIIKWGITIMFRLIAVIPLCQSAQIWAGKSSMAK